MSRSPPLETLVTAAEFGTQWGLFLRVERREIVERAARPISIAELAAHARDPESCLITLIGLVEHALARSTAA